MTKYHQLGVLNNRNLFFQQLWRLEGHDQSASRLDFFLGISPWLAEGCLLTVSSFGWPCVCVGLTPYIPVTLD